VPIGPLARLAALGLAALAGPEGRSSLAAVIWWEGEAPKEHNFPSSNAFRPARAAEKEVLSGGDWLQTDKAVPGERLFAKYEVEVPADAEYDFWVRQFWHHGPFRWRFDDDPWRVCDRSVAFVDSVELRQYVGANWKNAGRVRLRAGKHLLHLELLAAPGEAVPVALDCFMLADVPVRPSGKQKPLAVAERPAPAAAEPRGEGSYYLRPGDVILALGDAITLAGGFYRKIEEDLAREYPGLASRGGAGRVRVVNAGQAGATVADVLGRLPALLAEYRPTVSVVCLGTNDRYRDRAAFAAGMSSLVQTLQAASVAVTLVTPPSPCVRGRPELEGEAAVLAEMAEEIRRVAREKGAVLADAFAATKRQAEDSGRDLSWGDGIHPDDAGDRAIADAIQAAWGLGRPLAGPGRAGAGAPRPAAPARPSAEKTVVWDGDERARGNGWTHPKTPEMSLKVQGEERHSGAGALEFRAEGSQWLGFGWNWTAFTPGAGLDVSGYRKLSFWVKVKGAKPPAYIEAGLRSSSGQSKGFLNLSKYCPALADGEWHEVGVPLADFAAANVTYDPKTVWQVDIGTFSTAPLSFSLFLDDIAFE